jgi:hypothetical protein
MVCLPLVLLAAASVSQVAAVEAAASVPGWLTQIDTDAVRSGTAACTSKPHKVCVGTEPDAAACEATCAKAGSASCGVWAWSTKTHHCWHRTDQTWAPQRVAGVTSGCSTQIAACVPPVPPPPVEKIVTVTLSSNRSVGGVVSPHTPAVALDWWVKEDPKYGFQWGDASILVLDLQNPKLRAVATSLAPAVLRLGGSPIDSIEYAMTTSAVAACARGKGTPGGTSGFTCSQTGLSTYGCFTADRWRELLAFGKDTGLRIVLGLNACNGRPNASSTMDFSNIQSLLNYTVSLPAAELTALFGFEFGAETLFGAIFLQQNDRSPGQARDKRKETLSKKGVPAAGNEILSKGVRPTRWAEDANHLASLIRHSFEGVGLKPPPLIGPDHYSLQGYDEVISTLEQDTLTAVTYHDYPQCTPVRKRLSFPCVPSLS